MFAELETVQTLMQKYRVPDVWHFSELVALAKNDEVEFWGRFNTNEIWGSAGSLADQFLVSGNYIDNKEFHQDQVAFQNAMVSLARIMREKGILSHRADGWAKTFEHWNAHEL